MLSNNNYVPEGIIMAVQVLAVTTNQTEHVLHKQMNIQTDAIIGNQCGREAVEDLEYRGRNIRYLSTTTRGVGINRNQILMRANAEFSVFADDDMVFLDGYEETVCNWFSRLPDADIIVFNLEGGKKERKKTETVRRVHRFNYGKYGAARLALRTEAVQFSGVMFHTMFGGGCRYSCGEDTLFIHDCLKKGLKIVAVPAAIAGIVDGNSTWFCGYTDKFFYDKGVLYALLNGKTAYLTAVYHCVKHRKRYREFGLKNAIEKMFSGIHFARSGGSCNK